ncbi:helix-turn-helix transcriptional regulator [Nocardia fusca]|uniref:helix-turn-helix transcriptional regulator n=1 Tax=Nocardia fusca TaxID=941183 RepID=UPI0037A37027
MAAAERGARRGFAQRRKAMGFTREALGQRLNVERSTVVRWEAGKSESSPAFEPISLPHSMFRWMNSPCCSLAPPQECRVTTRQPYSHSVRLIAEWEVDTSIHEWSATCMAI